MKRRKMAVALATVAAALAMLAPATSHAATPTCIVVDGPSGFHLQIGYAPHGPSDCKHTP